VPGLYLAIYGLAVILIVAFMPDGIWGFVSKFFDRAKPAPAPGAPLTLAPDDSGGANVLETDKLSKHFGGLKAVDGVDIAVARGKVHALIGPNGSGKTTLLRVILGDLTPQEGAVRHGTNLEVAYFDQLHLQLDDARSVRDNVRDGADAVMINGRKRHILGYLEDFLFTPEQAAGPVARLSGGERNRLLLARLFTKPSNVLVMDEPTNDLDLETLELLEDLLIEYPGTLLLVSHDREFVNNVVTSTLVLEGEGRVKEYAGGYDDWLRQRAPDAPPAPVSGATGSLSARERQALTGKPPATPRRETPPRSRRLTYKEQRELESLPGQIEVLETSLGELHAAMADPSLYRQDPAEIVKRKARLQSLQQEISEKYQRWEELEKLREAGS